MNLLTIANAINVFLIVLNVFRQPNAKLNYL